MERKKLSDGEMEDSAQIKLSTPTEEEEIPSPEPTKKEDESATIKAAKGIARAANEPSFAFILLFGISCFFLGTQYVTADFAEQVSAGKYQDFLKDLIYSGLNGVLSIYLMYLVYRDKKGEKDLSETTIMRLFRR